MRVEYTKKVPAEHKEQLAQIAHNFEKLRKQSSKVIIRVGRGSLLHEGTHHRPFFVITYMKTKTRKGVLRVVLRKGEAPILNEKKLASS